MKKNKKIQLDSYEKDILSSFEAGEWTPVPKKKAKKYVEYAKAMQKKDKRINIRISSQDLEELQAIAIQEGIPYQTLVSSILHKFAVKKKVA